MQPTKSQPTRNASPIITVSAVTPGGPTETVPVRRTFLQRINWFGGRVLDIAESIGEGVVSLLGLDDSLFQDVLDNMTEEEMAAAVEVNEERNEEYRRAGIIPEMTLPDDLTVEDIGVDLYSTTGPQNYRKINNGLSNGDIESGGVEMKPTVSISRPENEFEDMNNANSQQNDTAAVKTTDKSEVEPNAQEQISLSDTSAV